MRKWFTLLVFVVAPLAHATDLEIGAGFATTYPHGHAEISGFSVADNLTLLAGVGDQAVWLGADTSFDLGVAGNLSAGIKARYNWMQDYRIEGKLGGVLGSKATVNLQAHYTTSSLTYFDQFQAFTLNPELDRSGFGAELDGKYRLDRQWTLTAAGKVGIENQVQLGLQYRDRELEYRAGAVWNGSLQGDIWGGTAGITYREDLGTMTVDALVGYQAGQVAWGVKGTVGVYELENFFNSDVTVFAAYEPYREAVFPLRYGVDLVTPLNNGTLNIGAYFTERYYTFRTAYKFTLDPEPEPEEDLNE